jgi:hypothetical protein
MAKRFPRFPWVAQGILLVIGVIGVRIFAVQVRGENSCTAQSFSFVKPGETTEAEMSPKCGAPWLHYETNVFENEIDPFVSDDEPEHYAWQLETSARTGKKLILVHVLEYRDEPKYTRYAKLVFHEGKLWYALVPPTAEERLPAWVKVRYGFKPSVRKIKVRSYDVRYTAELWTYPDNGVGFFRGIGELFEAKVLFTPRKN